jgi:hypothetical protein
MNRAVSLLCGRKPPFAWKRARPCGQTGIYGDAVGFAQSRWDPCGYGGIGSSTNSICIEH